MSTIRAIPVTVFVDDTELEWADDNKILADMTILLADDGWNVSFKKVPQITLEELLGGANFSDIDIAELCKSWQSGLPRKRNVESDDLEDGEECHREDEE